MATEVTVRYDLNVSLARVVARIGVMSLLLPVARWKPVGRLMQRMLHRPFGRYRMECGGDATEWTPLTIAEAQVFSRMYGGIPTGPVFTIPLEQAQQRLAELHAGQAA